METRIVVADFTGANKLDFYRQLSEQTACLDVSVVIANAGVMIVGAYENFPGSAL